MARDSVSGIGRGRQIRNGTELQKSLQKLFAVPVGITVTSVAG